MQKCVQCKDIQHRKLTFQNSRQTSTRKVTILEFNVTTGHVTAVGNMQNISTLLEQLVTHCSQQHHLPDARPTASKH